MRAAANRDREITDGSETRKKISISRFEESVSEEHVAVALRASLSMTMLDSGCTVANAQRVVAIGLFVRSKSKIMREFRVGNSQIIALHRTLHHYQSFGMSCHWPNTASKFSENNASISSCLQKVKGKRKPQSTPSSPSRGRAASSGAELQCTCMTADNLHRTRNGRVRYTGASNLPRPTLPPASSAASSVRPSAVAAARGDKSKRSNVDRSQQKGLQGGAAGDHRSQSTPRSRQGQAVAGSGQPTPQQQVRSRQQMAQAQYAARKEQAKSMDYSSQYALNQPSTSSGVRARSPRQSSTTSLQHARSKSSDNVFEATERGDRERCATACGNVSDLAGLSLDANTLKRMLNPLPTSAHSSPIDANGNCANVIPMSRSSHHGPLRPQTSLSSMRSELHAQIQQQQQQQQQQQLQQSRRRTQSMGRQGLIRQASRERDHQRPELGSCVFECLRNRVHPPPTISAHSQRHD